MKKDSKNNKFSTSSDPLELWKGRSLDLLKALHIVTVDGKINFDSRRKLKQVYHLIQFIEPLVQNLYTKHQNPHLVDMGAGKSYLGFMLYDLILRNQSQGHLTSVEFRPELCQKSKELAVKSGFDRMTFLPMNITEAAQAPEFNPQNQATSPHAVLALHACDTATDDAIAFGLRFNVDFMVLVPCCQAALARHLEKVKQSEIPWPGIELM